MPAEVPPVPVYDILHTANGWRTYRCRRCHWEQSLRLDTGPLRADRQGHVCDKGEAA